MADNNLRVTHATDVGHRPYQEDRFVVVSEKEGQKSQWIMAILDGHGGSEVSELVSGVLHDYFTTAMENYEDNTEEALRETMRLLNAATIHMEPGSTISLVVVPTPEENVAYVAVLGDSPVIIRDNDGKVITSPEHNVRSNIAERSAAVARGGVYDRGYIWDNSGQAGLQMSRALGDTALTGILSREADIYTVELGPESFIIVGSDGLFDPSHADTKNQAERLVQKVSGGADAQDLVNDALARRTGDNVTAIVWRAK